MRVRIISALLLSLILVVGATVFRVKDTRKAEPILVSVENNQDLIPNPSIATATADLEAPEEKNEQENLTTTDLVGRQLILDYVNLAASGQATNDSVNSLAQKYVDNIPSLNSFQKTSITEIKIIPDTEEAKNIYYNSLSQIVDDHQAKMDKAFANGENFSDLGPALYIFMKTLSSIYLSSAQQIKSLPAPSSLSSVHLELIDSFMASAESIGNMSYAEDDPAVAFAGIVALNNSLQSEALILGKINNILLKNGI